MKKITIDSYGMPAVTTTSQKKLHKKQSIKSNFSFWNLFTTNTQEVDIVANMPYKNKNEVSLEEFLEYIHMLGNKLQSCVIEENILNYKNAIKLFLSRVLKETVQIEQHHTNANILSQKTYTTVKVIDVELEKLIAEIINNQHHQLNLLGRMNELYGLLVNLLH